MTDFSGAARPITALEVSMAAKGIGVEVAALRAVLAVEARNSGFDSQRRPIILFEPHCFYRNLSGAQREQAIRLGLAYQNWGAQPYPRGQNAQYDRLAKAIRINPEAAFRSISMGLGQVLGDNYELAGCSSAKQMFEQAKESESAQLRHMVSFIKNRGLADELQRHDWKKFARYYNGTGQVDRYAGWLEREYQKWKRITGKPRDELTAQDLRDAGSKTVAAADAGKKAVVAASIAGPTAGAILDAATQGLQPVTQAIQTAQSAKSAWDWVKDNWEFLAVIGLTALFLVLCWLAWRAFHQVIEERVRNAQDAINLRF